MSKSQKLRERLNTLPKDFTWDEIVTLLSQYDFKIKPGAGSRRKFIREDGRMFNCHCPHPGNIVKLYVVKEVKNLLDELDNHE